MRFKSLIVGTIASVTVALSATSAQAADMTDPLYDQRVDWGTASAGQKAQADLAKVSYWYASGRIYARWQVRDLTDTRRTPQLLLLNDSGSLQINVAPGSTSANVNVDFNVKCYSTAYRSFSSNYISVSFPRTCFPKGRTFAPHGSANYQDAGRTVNVSDRSSKMAGTVVNP